MIDWKLFHSYLGILSKDELIQIIGEALPVCTNLITGLKMAVAEKDYNKVDDLAHSLKYTCNQFGATEAGNLALQLELMGKKVQEDRMDEVFPKLVAACNEWTLELSEYGKRLAGG
ncbi:MAG TPA: Hpt domain-containing protein [Bacteroidales bacterium]|nr:Hpt domain-containing protein [Bacteroidales bacterium]HPS62893.1 Hpt domain-containing protein [Bacteroidales bacterium]